MRTWFYRRYKIREFIGYFKTKDGVSVLKFGPIWKSTFTHRKDEFAWSWQHVNLGFLLWFCLRTTLSAWTSLQQTNGKWLMDTRVKHKKRSLKKKSAVTVRGPRFRVTVEILYICTISYDNPVGSQINLSAMSCWSTSAIWFKIIENQLEFTRIFLPFNFDSLKPSKNKLIYKINSQTASKTRFFIMDEVYLNI